MGLDANYPAVTMNDPNGTVTVFDQDHVPIGNLGPAPFQSESVNVVCRLKQWDDAYWYRLLNPSAWSAAASSAYVAAAETHELNPGQPYAIPDCSHVGCLVPSKRAAGVGAVVAGAAGALWWRRRRSAS